MSVLDNVAALRGDTEFAYPIGACATPVITTGPSGDGVLLIDQLTADGKAQPARVYTSAEP